MSHEDLCTSSVSLKQVSHLFGLSFTKVEVRPALHLSWALHFAIISPTHVLSPQWYSGGKCGRRKTFGVSTKHPLTSSYTAVTVNSRVAHRAGLKKTATAENLQQLLEGRKFIARESLDEFCHTTWEQPHLLLNPNPELLRAGVSICLEILIFS